MHQVREELRPVFVQKFVFIPTVVNAGPTPPENPIDDRHDGACEDLTVGFLPSFAHRREHDHRAPVFPFCGIVPAFVAGSEIAHQTDADRVRRV